MTIKAHVRPFGALPCDGSGEKWISGTGAPICPRCHAGPEALHVPRPRLRKGRWTGRVPAHPNMIVWPGIDVTQWRSLFNARPGR
jgi:hypothetical protein